MWNLIQGIYRFNRKVFHCCKGISLVEILVAIMLLSIIVSPLFLSLRGASKTNSDAESVSLATYYALGKMEEVLAMNFGDIPLSTPLGAPLSPPLSDTVTIQGRITNRYVYVELSDGTGDAVPDGDLKKITVTVEDITINTLKANYSYATF